MATLTGPLNKSANTSGTTLVAKATTDTTYSGAIGDMLVLAFVVNSSTATATVADSAGNTWTQIDIASGGANNRVIVFLCRLTVALPTNGTVTITNTSASRRASQLYKISGAGGFLTLNRLLHAVGATTALSTNSFGSTGDADEYAFKFDGMTTAGVASGRADATSGWTDKGTVDSGGATVAVGLGSSFIATTSRNASQFANTATQSTASARASIAFSIRGISAPPDTLVQTWSDFGGPVNTDTLTPLKTPVTGNTLIAVCGTNENTGADDINTPTGWTLIGTVRNAAGTHVRMKIFGITTAAWIALGSPAFTFTTTAAQRLQVSMAEFAGVYNLTPEATNTNEGTTGTSGTTGSVTPLGAGRLVLMAFAEKNAQPVSDAAVPPTFPSLTVWNEDVSVLSTQKINMFVGYVTNRGASATTISTTWTTSSTAWAGISVALAPASGPVNITATSTGTSTTTATLNRLRPLTATSTGASTTTGVVNRRRPLTATSTGASTTTGTLNRLRNLAATSTGLSTTTATLVRKRALTATSTGLSTTTGALTRRRNLTATSTGLSTTTGALTRRRPLSAASTGLSTSTGVLTRRRPLTATSTGLSTTTGTVTSLAPPPSLVQLTGTSTSTSATTARLSGGHWLEIPSGGSASAPNVAAYNGTQGPFDFVAEVAPTGAWAGTYLTLLGSVSQPGKVDRHSVYINPGGMIEHYWQNTVPTTALAASTAAVPFATGERGFVRSLLDLAAGTCTFYTSKDGINWTQLGAVVTGLSTSPLSSAGTGADFKIGNDNLGDPFVGKVYRTKFTASSVVLYDIDWTTAAPGTGPWTGADGLTWTAAAGANVPGATGAFTATSTSTSTTTATLTAKRALTATSTGASTTTATLNRRRQLTATSTGLATTTATLARVRGLTATSTGLSTTTGTLNRRRPLTGTSTGLSTTTATLVRKRALTATSTGLSTTTATLNRRRPLVATSTGASTTTGTVTSQHAPVVRQLTATSTGASTTTGVLTRRRNLVATSTGLSTTTGALVRKRALVATSTGASTTTASVARKRPLTATSTGASTTVALLSRKRAMQATSTGASVTTALLTRIRALVASSVGASSTTGVLAALTHPMEAVSVATSTTTGTLTRLVYVVVEQGDLDCTVDRLAVLFVVLSTDADLAVTVSDDSTLGSLVTLAAQVGVTVAGGGNPAAVVA